MANVPQISFLFPYRWLTTDRKYLSANLIKQIAPGGSKASNNNKNPMHDRLRSGLISVYGVRLKQHAYQPKAYKITKEEMAEIFGKIFPGATCAYLDKKFVQEESVTKLPTMEIEVYF